MINAKKYIQIPFKEHGRDESGLDCWGLIRLVLLREKGIELPSYTEEYSSTNDNSHLGYLIESYKQNNWIEVNRQDAKSLDAVLLRLKGSSMHVGIITNPPMMLHIIKNTNVVHVSYESILWRDRVVGIYRHKQLAG